MVQAFFAEHGYYHARGVFPADVVAELEEDFDRIVAQLVASGEDVDARWRGEAMARLGARGTRVTHTHNVQAYAARWLRALQHPSFLDIAETILGPDIVLHHTKLFEKPPGHGAPFPTHQDWSYFPMERDRMIAAVIHVSAATDAMGCIRVHPGSHRLGRLTASAGTEEGPNPVLADYPIDRALAVEAEPGDVVFFHYLTLHGSLANRSDRVRKTVLAQLHAGDDRPEPSDHPYARLTLRGWNHAATRGSVG